MTNKKSLFFGSFTLVIVSAILFTACNDNAKTKETVVVDSTNIKKTQRVLDTTAESRPLVPGGK